MSKSRVAKTVSLDQLTDPPKHLIARPVGNVKGLTEDIKKRGQLQSLLVRPGDKEGTFQVLAGRRRFAALRKAGESEAKCIIAHDLADDEKAMAAVYAENSEGNRTNLTPLEQARFFKTAVDLAKENGRKDPMQFVAAAMGTTSENVRRTLMILDAPASVQKQLAEGKISKDMVIALKQTDPEVQQKLVRAIDRGDVKTAPELRRAATEIAEEEGGKLKKPSDGRKRLAPKRVWLPPGKMTPIYENMVWQYAVFSGTVEDAETGEPNADFADIRRHQLAVFFALMGKTDSINAESKAFRKVLKREVARVVEEWTA